MIDGQYIINPTIEQAKVSRLNLAVAGTKDAILMVEAGAKEISEDEMLDAIWFGPKKLKSWLNGRKKLWQKLANPKWKCLFTTSCRTCRRN